MTTMWEGPPRMRSSDSEREEVVTRLRTAISDGRLSLGEGEERIAAVYGSRFRDELAPFTTDLPPEGADTGWSATAPYGGGSPDTPETRAAQRRWVATLTLLPVAVLALVVSVWVSSGGRILPLFPLVIVAFFLLRRAAWRRHVRYGGPGPHGWGHGRPDHWSGPPWGAWPGHTAGRWPAPGSHPGGGSTGYHPGVWSGNPTGTAHDGNATTPAPTSSMDSGMDGPHGNQHGQVDDHSAHDGGHGRPGRGQAARGHDGKDHSAPDLEDAPVRP